MKMYKRKWILYFVFLFVFLLPFIKSQASFDPNNLEKTNNVVPASYSGPLAIKEGTAAAIGGKEYSFGKVSKITVDKGIITEFDGTLNNEAEIKGNHVKGTLSS